MRLKTAGCMANSVGPDTPHSVVSNQGLHCLFIVSEFSSTIVNVANVSRFSGKTDEQKYEKQNQNLLSENFHFMMVKFSVYLKKKHIFLMYTGDVK